MGGVDNYAYTVYLVLNARLDGLRMTLYKPDCVSNLHAKYGEHCIHMPLFAFLSMRITIERIPI